MSGCTLRLARNSPLRTTLVEEATGHAKYQIDTPIKVAGSVTRIRKFESPTDPPPNWDEDSDSDQGDDTTGKGKKSKSKKDKKDKAGEARDGAETELPETSDEIARIYWKWFSTDRITSRGRITTRAEFLPKTGKAKGSYVFTAPDGVQYRWVMGAFGLGYPKLVTTDEKKSVIAAFHRSHHFTRKEKAKLEVQPAGMDMLDHIVLTWVFAESKRRDRQNRVKAASSSGGGGGG